MTEDEAEQACDEAILDAYDDARAQVSYYNAAESPQYSLEREGRCRAYTKLRILGAEITKRGIKPRKGDYLL